MPIPSEYQRASLDFDKFMVDARDMAGLATTNMAWNMVVGVLHTFRHRLNAKDAVRFAHVLPPVLRAIFVADWNTDEPPLPFGDRAAMTREVQSLRAEHNFAPDTAIHDVATALRRTINEEDLDHMLASLPNGAADFWRV